MMSNVQYRSAAGFTLIELLIVMSIVSALVAIAIPRYAAYKATAFDTRAELDLRSVAIAEEAYFLQHEEYLGCSNESCTQLPGIKRLSAGVTLEVRNLQDGFVGTSTHPQGTGRVFTWDSNQGGLLEP
jgi:prepilin-type N-terminal cleavage/methylation domain-containing protein